MAMWLCLVVCLALLVASGLGVAYGYNYSLAEYIYLKPEGQAFYLRRGRLVNERKVPQIQYPNLAYDPRIDRFSEQNANPEGKPGGAPPPPPGGVAPLTDVSTDDPFKKLKMLQMLTTTNKEDLMSDNEGPPFPKFVSNKETPPPSIPTPTAERGALRNTELRAPVTLINHNPLMLSKFKTLGWPDNKIDKNELQDKTETAEYESKGSFDAPADEDLKVRPKEQADVSMYGFLEKKDATELAQKAVTRDTEILGDLGVRGLDRPARPADAAPVKSVGRDSLEVEPIKLMQTEKAKLQPERTTPTEQAHRGEQEEESWEPQEAQESMHGPTTTEEDFEKASSDDYALMHKFEPVDIFSGTKVDAIQRTRGLEVIATYKTAVTSSILLSKLSQ